MIKLTLTEKERDAVKNKSPFYRVVSIGYDGLNIEPCVARIGKTTYYFSVSVENIHGSTVVYHYSVVAYKRNGSRPNKLAARNELVNRSVKSLAETFAEEPNTNTLNSLLCGGNKDLFRRNCNTLPTAAKRIRKF